MEAMRNHHGVQALEGDPVVGCCSSSPPSEWRDLLPAAEQSSVDASGMPTDGNNTMRPCAEGAILLSGRNSFFSSESSDRTSAQTTSTFSDEWLSCPHRPRGAGGPLQLYPSGTVEKPWRYDTADWEAVMTRNRRWPYHVEQQGLVILLRGMLSSCLILADVLSASLSRSGSLDKRVQAKLRNLIRQQLQAQDLHIMVTTTLVELLEKKGLNVPGNILVLLRMQRRRQLGLGGAFQQLEQVGHKGSVTESVFLLRSILDLLKEYFQGALTLARLEIEDMLFMIRKHSSHRAVEKIIENRVFIQNSDLCGFPVLALLLGSLEPEGRSHKVANVTTAPEPIARVMAMLYQRAYRKKFLKPAQTVLLKFDEASQRPPSAPYAAWSNNKSATSERASTPTSFEQSWLTLEGLNPKNLLRNRRGMVTEPSASPSQQLARDRFAAAGAGVGSNSGRFTA